MNYLWTIYFYNISIYGIGKLHGIGICNNHTCAVHKKNSISWDHHSFWEIIYIENKKQRNKVTALWDTVSNRLPFRVILPRFISYNYSSLPTFQIRLNEIVSFTSDTIPMHFSQ